jgi:hypothetical protein
MSKRMVVLAALVMAVLMVFASAAQAKKKQRLNVVQCPTGGSSTQCVGTSASDRLLGRDGDYDYIQGGEGNDTYDGKGSCDALDDASLTSNDTYLVDVTEFCNVGISSLSIQDKGGRNDTLDLRRFYKSTDFELSKGYTNLHLDGPGVNDIDILDFFTPDSSTADSIDVIKFKDKTLTAQQIRDMGL